MTVDMDKTQITDEDREVINDQFQLIGESVSGITGSKNGYTEERNLDRCIKHLTSLSVFLNKLLDRFA